MLDQKVKIDLSKLKRPPTFADVAEQVAQQCGYAVICEDFPEWEDREALSKTEAIVLHALQQVGAPHDAWYVNDQNKTILGWADSWRERHRNLVSESLLIRVREKMNGEGLDIDDVAEVMGLSLGQMGEWVARIPETESLCMGVGFISFQIPFWQFYNELAPAHKALAKSEQGLALGKLDPVWMTDFFNRKRAEASVVLGGSGSPEFDEQVKAQYAAVLDTQIVTSVVMRVKREPKPTSGPDQKASTLQRYGCIMELQGYRDGKSFTTRISGPMLPFPVYSAKREAELEKSGEKKGK